MGDSTLKSSPRTWRFAIISIKLCVLIISADKLFTGFAVNGQIVKRIEGNSSPSSLAVTKGSSVWLHWNYTYVGDGAHSGGITTITTNYNEQVIRFNSTSQPTLQTLAKRIGQNGALTLESSIPAPFAGRVDMISSNSTLVIHNLQYNDSTYQFSSNVKVYVNTGGGPVINTYALRPIAKITVNGIPNFIRQPPNALDVNEGANLTLQVEMDGSPKPSADFKWSHLIGSSPINVPGVQLYPSVYSSVYPLNNIDASYCGRILETTIKNSVGSSSTTAATNVTVLLKLDKTFDLKAGKIAVSKCIGVEWNKAESGACYVKYEVAFSNASGYYVHSETGYNIDKMRICNLTAYSNITDVQLTVSFKATSKTVTAKVSETPITTPPPTPSESTNPSVSQNAATASSSQTPGSSGNPKTMPKNYKNGSGSDSNSGLIVGASVGGVVFLIIVIVIIVVCIKKSKRSKMDEDSCSPDYPLQEGQYAVASDVSRKPQEPTYADPNKATLIYGKLNENAGDRPRHTRKEDTSDYADVKVDERGYPAVGAMLTSYTDGYGERSRSRGDSGRDSGRRTAPERRPPPPYSDPDPHSTCLCTGE